ncbi:P-loop containing nucleoside triphosphate hydrolase protein [Leptodontidium sp. 2 PMI_412]|nr:P-loop containing nucleoside triphosphate hydrolase protein [Leptodontidium sp. 2 PMI_412]
MKRFGVPLTIVQTVVLDKLTGQKRIKLQGYDEEMQNVYQVVEKTVLAGEGNSMLVVGPRGCGKTTLVESVISDLSGDHRERFHVVRLNVFIHTDDKSAAKEVWRQLGREMEVGDDLGGKICESPADRVAKSVIFVLDEFDLFTTHPCKTLLYNLFDIAQARKAPVVVLGLTTRIDIVESFEKRVKSRFSTVTSLTSRHRTQTSSTGLTAVGVSVKVWGRDIALGAWERLADCELLVPAGIGRAGGRDPGSAGLLWKVDVELGEIASSVEGLSGVLAKWCREI